MTTRRRIKKHNDYCMAAGRDLFEAIPKAVWAAIAISALTCGGDEMQYARERVLKEWNALHLNNIVPQAPAGPLAVEARSVASRATGTE